MSMMSASRRSSTIGYDPHFTPQLLTTFCAHVSLLTNCNVKRSHTKPRKIHRTKGLSWCEYILIFSWIRACLSVCLSECCFVGVLWFPSGPGVDNKVCMYIFWDYRNSKNISNNADPLSLWVSQSETSCSSLLLCSLDLFLSKGWLTVFPSRLKSDCLNRQSVDLELSRRIVHSAFA